MSINRVELTGNLTRPAELSATAGGTQVLRFSLAVGDRRKSAQTGEWEDVPNFVDCAMFGRRAEALRPYLAKGAKVAVEGKLRYSAWQAKDGQRRSKLEVVVDEVELMSRRPETAAAARPAPAPAPQTAEEAARAVREAFPGAAPAPATYDDDIEF